MPSRIAILFILTIALAADAQAVTIDWSPVGDAGNSNDPATGNLYGGVSYNYRIGTYDVTNNQYAEFLNVKDPTGANALGLYALVMSNPSFGGISFSNLNSPGSKYTVVSGAGNHPVNYVTWYSAIRFANWLNNGQGGASTETGAYTLIGGTAAPSNGDSITRNGGATVFLPSESEWYKAAYYDPSTSMYNQYPTSSNLTPNASGPTATVNSANYNDAVGNLTDVGAYTGTMSPYRAFDMGGNVLQWNETLVTGRLGSFRTLRGGAYNFGAANLGPSVRSFQNPAEVPPSNFGFIGFRLAMIPEPSSLVLAAFGLVGLALYGWRKRLRA